MITTKEGRDVTVGSKVAYSVQFLKTINAEHTEVAHARGVVTELLEDSGLVKVDWGDGDSITSNPKALAIVGINLEFSNA